MVRAYRNVLVMSFFCGPPLPVPTEYGLCPAPMGLPFLLEEPAKTDCSPMVELVPQLPSICHRALASAVGPGTDTAGVVVDCLSTALPVVPFPFDQSSPKVLVLGR